MADPRKLKIDVANLAKLATWLNNEARKKNASATVREAASRLNAAVGLESAEEPRDNPKGEKADRGIEYRSVKSRVTADWKPV